MESNEMLPERQVEYLRYCGQIRQTRLPRTWNRLYDSMDLHEFIEKSKIKTS